MREQGDSASESGCIETRRILVVDPDAVYRTGLVERLLSRGFTPIACGDASGALRWLGRGRFVAVWADYRLDSPSVTGAGLLLRAHARFPRASLILTTAHHDEPFLQTRIPSAGRVFAKADATAALAFLMERHGIAADAETMLADMG